MYRAVMDVGTNSCRLIVVEIKENGDHTHVRESRITRIGEGLGHSHFQISPIAMERTLAALQEYKEIVAGYPVEKIRLLGTQALREAGNGYEFVIKVKERTGLTLEIISGEQEAYLSYAGAVKSMADFTTSMPLVLDIGAGSTELFLEVEEADGVRRIRGASAPVGCLRLLEKPMDTQGINAALESGWEGLILSQGQTPDTPGEQSPEGQNRNALLSESHNRPLVAVGGTATTLGAVHLAMKEYDPEALLGLRMSRIQVEDILKRLKSLSLKERLELPGVTPGREDVLPWGIKILLAVMGICKRQNVVICDRDLLYGALYE